MANRVAIVTDSTCYLPTDWAARLHIDEVPVQVIVSGRAYREGVDISTAQVADALKEWQPVSTSRPSPADFLAAYQRAAEAGADYVVSIHLSGELSGTLQTAQLAAKQSPVPVTVVDSRTLAMGLGFACVTAATVAEAGGSVEDVVAAATQRAESSNTYFYVDTLEYLKRGGRIGKAAAALGAALRVKPLLTVHNGQVEMLEKARTPSKALARLRDISLEAANRVRGEVDVAVQHIGAAARADQLAEELSVHLGGRDVVRIEIGAVVGAHVGPGCVAVTVSPRLPPAASLDDSANPSSLSAPEAGDVGE